MGNTWYSRKLASSGFAILTATMLALSASSATAQSDPRLIEGVWAVTSTPRDCDTGAVVGSALRALLTFHQGGTVTERVAFTLEGFNVGFQKAFGQGVWMHRGGRDYTERVATIIEVPGLGLEAGWSVSTQIVSVIDEFNFTSIGDVVFFNLNRQPVGRNCSSRIGERFR